MQPNKLEDRDLKHCPRFGRRFHIYYAAPAPAVLGRIRMGYIRTTLRIIALTIKWWLK